ncbi:LytTR family DNA-binding domain-containing protein [Pseudotabrizicola sp. L79]|uniref:LytTR family DNA-binding domain-containing protein n=1 Tax=Pseudotabrizicola sp. L79 TaxID=3118402 RepID=UPI002F95FB66
MRIVFVNGTQEQITWHEMRQLFWHPRFVALVMSISAIVVALRPYDDLINFNALRLTIFYANGVLWFLVFLVGTVYLTQRFGLTVFSMITVPLATTGATMIGMVSGVLLGAPFPLLSDLFLVTVFNCIFGVLGEIVLASFLLPGIMRDIRGQAAEPKAPTVPPHVISPYAVAPSLVPETSTAPHFGNVLILGTSFALPQILAIKADEHYVQVFLTSGQTRLLRGRMSDAVAAMPETAGRLIHRSHWVAAQAVSGVQSDARSTMVVLRDGTKLPVARGRVPEIKEWIETLEFA